MGGVGERGRRCKNCNCAVMEIGSSDIGPSRQGRDLARVVARLVVQSGWE